MGRRAVILLLVIGMVGIAGAVVLSARPAEPSKVAEPGSTLYSVAFDEPGQWEEGNYAVPHPRSEDILSESILSVADGRYQIAHKTYDNASFVIGVGGASVEQAENVIIEVKAEPLEGTDDNLYGIVCRLITDEDGAPLDGYALLISGDGHFGIAEINNRSLDFVLEWHQSAAIRQGRAPNTIRAVCVDDYLALYANGEFLGEIGGATRRPGQVGLIAGANRNGSVRIAFDDLVVSEGTIRNP